MLQLLVQLQQTLFTVRTQILQPSNLATQPCFNLLLQLTEIAPLEELLTHRTNSFALRKLLRLRFPPLLDRLTCPPTRTFPLHLRTKPAPRNFLRVLTRYQVLLLRTVVFFLLELRWYGWRVAFAVGVRACCALRAGGWLLRQLGRLQVVVE